MSISVTDKEIQVTGGERVKEPNRLNSDAIKVFHIADWFLSKSLREKTHMTHEKLQNLVYFAYGWYYAFFGRPLFKETILAGPQGPVIADLYGRLRRSGEEHFHGDFGTKRLEQDVLEVLEATWDAYADRTDIELRSIICRYEAPWARVYQTYGRYASIEPHEVQDYFETLANE